VLCFYDIVTCVRLLNYLVIHIQVVGFLLLNMYFHLVWSLQSITNEEAVSGASLASLLSKRDTLLQELEYFLNLNADNKEGGKPGSELACRVRELQFICLFLCGL